MDHPDLHPILCLQHRMFRKGKFCFQKFQMIANFKLGEGMQTSFAGNPLLTFESVSVTDEFVLKIINSASAKSCELDPIPTTFLYENLDILLPTITNIINTSLTTGIVPPDLKTAIVKPLLKKPSLDKNLLKNYRPISNLPFFCPKFLKKSFSTNFSPISKKTTSAIPFSQPIEQDAALRPFCYIL